MPETLKRSLSLFTLTFYGIGSILGAGIYVITGKVAYYSGMLTPFAFLLSAVIAAFSAMSFAELSSRYPQSAGEAGYVKKAFNNNFLVIFVGWLVILTGVVSTAAMANGFVGYLHLFLSMPDNIIKTVFILSLGTLAFWGIKESVWVIVVITLIEILGLIIVMLAGITHFNPDKSVYSQLIYFDKTSLQKIVLGAFVAFYAFVGFEDMVNVAEEVKNPTRTVGISLILAVIISSILYIILSVVVVTTVPIKELINSNAPMAVVIQKAGYSTVLIGLIGLITVINGALVNIIMASRVIYGMANLKVLPALFGKVHRKRQTPHVATLFITVLTLILAIAFPILILAQVTSFIMLLVYFFVNLSLVVIKSKKSAPQQQIDIIFPIAIPILGVLITCLFLFLQFLL